MTNDRRDDPAAGDELHTRLEAYARAQLSGDPLARARTRAAVMAEARVALRRAAVQRRRPRFLRLGRRPVLAFLAAGLAVVALAGGTVASGPGGPLYGARLFVEAVALPDEAAARAEAEVARLDTRLAEAELAAAIGNGEAVRAALEAYRATVDEALRSAGDVPDRAERLKAALERHRVVLGALVDGLPERASEAVQRALARGDRAIDEIGHGKPADRPGNGPGGKEDPRSRGDDESKATRPRWGTSASPAPSHKPRPTPSPAASPTVPPGHDPDRSPRASEPTPSGDQP